MNKPKIREILNTMQGITYSEWVSLRIAIQKEFENIADNSDIVKKQQEFIQTMQMPNADLIIDNMKQIKNAE